MPDLTTWLSLGLLAWRWASRPATPATPQTTVLPATVLATNPTTGKVVAVPGGTIVESTQDPSAGGAVITANGETLVTGTPEILVTPIIALPGGYFLHPDGSVTDAVGGLVGWMP